MVTFHCERGPTLTDTNPTSTPSGETARHAPPDCVPSMLKAAPYGSRPEPGAYPAAEEPRYEARSAALAQTDVVTVPADLRVLLDVADRHFAARLAMELYCFRLARDLGAMCDAAEGAERTSPTARGGDADVGLPRAGGAIHAQLARLRQVLDEASQRQADPPPAGSD